jgi:glyoxylase-like metal-dependent hydrolase (beta-lactamase superfamily II)
MIVETFPVAPLGCNCSIVADPSTKRAVVIDPGGELDKILARLSALELTVDAIVHTHTHIDHVGATAGLSDRTGARALIHEDDRFLYDLLPVQAAMLGVPEPPQATMHGELRDGSSVGPAGVDLGVLHTPGHTPGSVCFVLHAGGTTRVFTGDTLFRRGIGRTDLWGGDTNAILRSLRDKLLTLPHDAMVITGHGPSTTIGDEARGNPFLR